MNCLGLERWLDGGELSPVPHEVAEHTAGCARCARALVNARALERELERAFSATELDSPSAGFTDHVMSRVDALAERGVRPVRTSPRWSRVVLEPSVALAACVAVLMAWKGGALVALAQQSFQALSLVRAPEIPGLDLFAPLVQALEPVPGAGWAVGIAVAIGFASPLLVAGWALWRAGERLAADPRLGF